MVESTPPLPFQRNVIRKKDMLISACGDSIVIQKGIDAENRKKRQIFPEAIRFLLSIGDEKTVFLAMSSNQIALFQMKKNMPIVMFDVDDEIIGHGEYKVTKNEEKGGEFKLSLIIPLAFRSGTVKNMRLTVNILDSKIVKQRVKSVEEMRMEGEELKMCVSLGSNSFFGVYEDTVVKSDGLVTRAGEPSLKKKRRIAVVGRDLWNGNMIMATENGSIRVVGVKDEEEKGSESMKILSEGQCIPPYCTLRCRQPTVIISTENTVFVGTQRGEIHCLSDQLELRFVVQTEGGPINCLKVDVNDFDFLWAGFEGGELRRFSILPDLNEDIIINDDEVMNHIEDQPEKKVISDYVKRSETEMECPEKGCYFKTRVATTFKVHLIRVHRTTLALAGLVFRCQCGNESLSHYHSLTCTISNFTIVRKNFGPVRTLADEKMTPKCTECEIYPTTALGYTDHLGRMHHKSLQEMKCYLKCSCGVKFYNKHHCEGHPKICKSRFFTKISIREEGEKNDETEMDQTADQSMDVDNRDQEME